jgi:tetratricopeptide (TPR) repeat protein
MLAALVTFFVAAYIARHPLVRPAGIEADFAALKQAYEAGNPVLAAASAEKFIARYPRSTAVAFADFVLAEGKWAAVRANASATIADLSKCLTLYRKAQEGATSPVQEARILGAEGDIMLLLDQPNDAIEAYTALLEKYPSEFRALPDLAVAYSMTNPPNTGKAKDSVAAYLAMERLSPEETQKGYIAKARVELAAKEYDAAAQSARRVVEAKGTGERAGEARLLLAKALFGQGDHAGALASAEAADPASGGRFEGPLNLVSAMCQWRIGSTDAALKAFEDTIFRFPGSTSALSARYELARAFEQSGQVDAARDALRNLVNEMSLRQVLETSEFSLDDVTDLWFAVGRAILSKGDYGAARDFHKAAAALMSHGQFVFFDATLYLREAEQTEAGLPGLPSLQQETAQARVKQLYHEAGVLFSKVLESPSSRLYARALMSAGHAFYLAGDYTLAARYLREFTKEDLKSAFVPQALYEEAQSLASVGNYEAAIALCNRNSQAHPRSIYAYRAMLLQAQLYGEMGGQDLAYAAKGYEDILVDARFLPSSNEWRRAIFALGRTLYELGEYRDSVLKLDEAIHRFPDDPEAIQAQFYLGLASRQLAFSTGEEKADSLARAAEIFSRLASGSSQYSAAAAFLEADCHYDLGDFQKALGLYDRAVEAHVETPDAARALFQMANCYHKLGRTAEAEATYKRAVFNLTHRRQSPAPGEEFYRSVAQWRSKGEA